MPTHVNSHIRLLACSWSHAARCYLETGNAFLAASMHATVLDPSQLAGMDSAKALLEQQDAIYNQALDTLEVGSHAGAPSRDASGHIEVAGLSSRTKEKSGSGDTLAPPVTEHAMHRHASGVLVPWVSS